MTDVLLFTSTKIEHNTETRKSSVIINATRALGYIPSQADTWRRDDKKTEAF